MSALILDGRKTRDEILPGLIERLHKLSYTPVMAIIQIGSRVDSTAYISAKEKFAEKLGLSVRHIQLAETVTLEEVLTAIEGCNNDPHVRGIIVQLPLPLGLDREVILEAIDPNKDVDGLTSLNVKRWLEGSELAILPATARGIRELLKAYNMSLFQKKVVVVGRSTLVGKPIEAMCLSENATVTVCHSKTPDLAKETSTAEILIVAVGKPVLIGPSHVVAGQTVIDVGISSTDDEPMVGDVDTAAVSEIVSAISPVPGGVGPMTVTALFENFLDLCERRE